MSTELEDLERRVELLEGQLASAEYRLDLNQMHLDIVTGWRQVEREAGESATAVVQDVKLDAPDVRFGQLESMLRQVLLHQSDHAAGLKRVTRSVRILVERKTS